MAWTGPYGWRPAAAPMADPMVPAASVLSPTIYLHSVSPGDTLYNLALAYGTTAEAIARANPGVNPANLAVGSVLRIPVPAYIPYQVQPGDTLWAIAQNYGVNWQDLAALNGITDPNNLPVGFVLQIPIA